MARNEIFGSKIDVLDYGFVRYVDSLGDESAIVQAARVSYGEGTMTARDDRGLIRYLMRHHHNTPLEQVVLKLHVKAPIFVARQWMRHRTGSFNEVSARYSVLPSEFYVPQIENICHQSADSKQGRGGALAPMAARTIRDEMEDDMRNVFDHYMENTTDETVNLARETARITLPLATYTEFYWKIDLHNLLHFLRLRMDNHAQKEIRVYAEAIARIVKAWMPVVWEAFEDYRLNAVTFSGPEMRVLYGLLVTFIENQDDVAAYAETKRDDWGLTDRISKRELRAFLEALR